MTMPCRGNVPPDILLDYRAFRKGKLLPGQSGKQSEALRVDAIESPDAEFYARKAHVRVVDLPALRLDVEAAQLEVVSGYVALAGVSGMFRNLKTESVRLCKTLKQVEKERRLYQNNIGHTTTGPVFSQGMVTLKGDLRMSNNRTRFQIPWHLRMLLRMN